jgi:DnaJ-class molecular chaperone
MSVCTLCNGNKTVTCPKCDGVGQLPEGEGSYKTCFHCNGRGDVTCPRCEGTGT